MAKIILATTSPYRQQAFKMLGINFEAIGSDVDECFEGRPEKPEELVLELAKLKAEAVAEKCEEGIVIGFDSIGYFEGEVLEKPKSREEAFERLKKLSGKDHLFFTGIYMIDISGGKVLRKVVETKVKMRKFSEKEIEHYLNLDDKTNTYALGYDPLEKYSSTFVESIEGSYNNLTRGIPLETIMGMLNEINGLEL